MKYIDLHTHSSSSDGTYTPGELVNYALEKQLAAIALTDHDTIDGLGAAFAAARGTGLEVVSGVEFSTEFHGKDVHIVGLDFDYSSSHFQTQLKIFKSSRELRNEKMIQKLRETGFDITWEAMEKEYGKGVWTRAHFGRYLLEHGYVTEISDAFRLYLGDNSPCFVPREKVTPAQAVRLIRQTGGIPVLAHPLLYHLPDEVLQELIDSLKAAGLLALEAVYSTYTGYDEDHMRRLARTNQLCISGGSDFHGKNKPSIDLGTGRGNLRIPYEVLKELRKVRDTLC